MYRLVVSQGDWEKSGKVGNQHWRAFGQKNSVSGPPSPRRRQEKVVSEGPKAQEAAWRVTSAGNRHPQGAAQKIQEVALPRKTIQGKSRNTLLQFSGVGFRAQGLRGETRNATPSKIVHFASLCTAISTPSVCEAQTARSFQGDRKGF